MEEETETNENFDEDSETDHLWVRAKLSAAQEFAQEHGMKDSDIVLPKDYQKWKEVFDKQKSERYPSS